MNKAGVALSSMVLLGVLSTHLNVSTIQAPTQIMAQQLAPAKGLTTLERARQASFDIVLSDFKLAGSAVLIGRVLQQDGSYRYRALTAYHVVREMSEAMIHNKINANRKMLMTFQPAFHGQPLQLDLNIEDVDWAAPSEDWASFTFISPQWLACADVATEVEFRAIKPWEDIYLVACFGAGYAQHLRKGIIGATHNIGVYPDEQRQALYPWNKHPDKFFRTSTPIWFGDSGGAIFNKDGKLIGIVNGLTVGGWDPVTHAGVALKTYIIRDVVQHSKDFFKIED